jgi:ABC-2 type transport system permease protein
MLDLLKAEILKVRSTRTAFGLLVAALLIAVVPTILAVLLIPKEDLVQTEGDMIAVLGVMPAATLVPILCLVFGILSMTNEYRHGTVSYTYLTTPKRGQVIVVKLLVCAVIGAAVMLVTGFIAIVAAGIGAELRGVDLGVQASDAGDWEVLRAVALVLLTTGLATAFGVALGALIRHQVITVAGTLIWALAVENIISGLKPSIGEWLPFTVFLQVVVNAGGVEEAAVPSLSSLEAVGVSLAYIALASVAAVFITMRRDVT